ncbi:ATP-binding protein [Desulfobacterales bacterium HSG16]|nr:ATP-binding protein [Desulfobacterales bacterium HSG16]
MALRKNEENLRSMFNAISESVFLFDNKGVLLTANNTFAVRLGKQVNDCVGKSIKSLIPDDVAAQRMTMVEKIIQSGQPVQFEEQSQQCWTYYSLFPVLDSSGLVDRIAGFEMDITDQKKYERSLKESEKQFRHFFEHLPIGVAVYESVNNGEDFIFSDINITGQKLSKVSIDEIRGKKLTQVFPGARELGLFKALQDSWRTGKPYHVPFRQYKDERIIQWVENRIFRHPSGKVVALYDDRTKLMRLEEGLRQTQKMEAVGTLAGGIAHDFNNMLGVITGNISYALSILNNDDELYEVLSDVQESSKQAQSLTHQLLTFSKGGAPIKKVSNINRLIKESAIFSLRGAKANCDFVFLQDLFAAEIDEGQINQVIGNLVINANQAMANGGTIKVRTENAEIGAESDLPLSTGRYIKIIVEDQGIGISQKHISNIFEPYFSTKQKGSGLGLATTYSIIKKHDGHISVYSEIEKGTVFTIYLPASLKAVDKIKDSEKFNHIGHGKILIMDDQKPILDMVERMLNRMEYETAAAIDGTQAVKMYREAHLSSKGFDLVILDLTVPGGMGGAETIVELLKVDPKVKAVVSSGYSNDPVMANYENYGFCGVIPKPYTKSQLSELLNKIFGDKC